MSGMYHFCIGGETLKTLVNYCSKSEFFSKLGKDFHFLLAYRSASFHVAGEVWGLDEVLFLYVFDYLLFYFIFGCAGSVLLWRLFSS